MVLNLNIVSSREVSVECANLWAHTRKMWTEHAFILAYSLMTEIVSQNSILCSPHCYLAGQYTCLAFIFPSVVLIYFLHLKMAWGHAVA
jgi:hypothetical protein